METALSLWNFGDSGAFPEFHVKQYPSGFGKHIIVVDQQQQQQQTSSNNNNSKNSASVNNNQLMIIQTSKSTLNASSFSSDELAKPDQEYIANLEEETRRQLEAARNRTSQVSSGVIGTAGVVGVVNNHRSNNKNKTEVIQTEDGRTIAVTEITRDISDPRKMQLQKVSTLEIQNQQQHLHKLGDVDPKSGNRALVLMQQQHHKDLAAASMLAGGATTTGPLIRSPTKKLSAKEAEAFAVPAAVYAHRNPKSMLISAEERAKHDGATYIEQTISSKHADAARAVMEATRRVEREDEQRRRDEEAEQERRNDEEKRRLLQQAKLSLANQMTSAQGGNGGGGGGGFGHQDYEERSREMEQRRRLKQLQRTADTLGMDVKDLLAQDDDVEVDAPVSSGGRGGGGKGSSSGSSLYDSRLQHFLQTSSSNPDAALGYDNGLFRSSNNNNNNYGGDSAASMVSVMGNVDRDKLLREQMLQDSLRNQQPQGTNSTVVASAEELEENETFDEDEDVFGVNSKMMGRK